MRVRRTAPKSTFNLYELFVNGKNGFYTGILRVFAEISCFRPKITKFP